MLTSSDLRAFTQQTISGWMNANIDRCCSVQAFGAQVEHWLKAELAVSLRNTGLRMPQPIAVDVERKPAQFGNVGGGEQADILIALPEEGRNWPGRKGPRLWVELKMRTHFTWQNLDEDRGKWNELSADDSALYVMLASYRHRNNGDHPKHRAEFERSAGLTPAVDLTTEFHGWTSDKGTSWPYQRVTHCLYMCEG